MQYIRASDMSLVVVVESAQLGCTTWHEETVRACRPQVPQVASRPICIWRRDPQRPQCFRWLAKGVHRRISYASLLTSAILLLRQPPLVVVTSTSRQDGPQVRHLMYVSKQAGFGRDACHALARDAVNASCADHTHNDTQTWLEML